MSTAEWLLVVDAEVDPSLEEEWNQWYDHEHLPEIVDCPGFLRGARYVSAGESGRHYVAIYELTGSEAMSSQEFAQRRGWRQFADHVRASVRLHRLCTVEESRSQAGDTWYFEQHWGQHRRGSTQLSLNWDGGEARAVLYDVGVPKTVAALLDALPLTIPVVHAAWSGDMLMSTTSYDILAREAENEVRLVQPGDLTWDPKFGELAFAYGTAEAYLPSGPNMLVVYGSVVEGLDRFASFAATRRFDGAADLKLERSS